MTPAPRWAAEALAVGAGGFVGAVLRYWVSGVVYQVIAAPRLPWGTLVVNALGCFAIGLLGGLVDERGLLTPGTRLFMMIGLLGGFTTFSTFGYETLALLRQQALLAATANVTLQVAACLAAAWGGLTLSRAW